MNSEMLAPPARTGFGALRRFVRRAPAAEYCAICSAGMPEIHQHLVDLENRALPCACDACAVLFSAQCETRYKRVQRRIRRLTDMRMAEEQWESLSIPVNTAFLFYNSRAAKPMAVYPSPAGATESSLPLAAWEHIVASSPALAKMEPDVEALLVNRLPSGGGHEYYKLVGIIRTQVGQELDTYFARLREAASPINAPNPHAHRQREGRHAPQRRTRNAASRSGRVASARSFHEASRSLT